MKINRILLQEKLELYNVSKIAEKFGFSRQQMQEILKGNAKLTRNEKGLLLLADFLEIPRKDIYIWEE